MHDLCPQKEIHVRQIDMDASQMFDGHPAVQGAVGIRPEHARPESAIAMVSFGCNEECLNCGGLVDGGECHAALHSDASTRRLRPATKAAAPALMIGRTDIHPRCDPHGPLACRMCAPLHAL